MRELPELTISLQYYRQPTPLPSEWDRDLAAIKEMGIDMVQLRPQWRWHERNEGELNFDDLDRILEVVAKHDLLAMIKPYLPTAPEWIFDEYGGHRVKPNGEVVPALTYGATYVGGFMPCFDQDIVREKANPFLRELVKRYRDHPNLLAWNAWNEPRSRPAWDCACKDSMKKWRAWLKDKFGTIEALNEYGGLCLPGKGADFSSVKAPVIYNDYLGLILFRTWRMEMVADRVKWVADEIRKLDKNHTIMAHVGFSSVLQDALEDTSNDYLNARCVDMYGSSCPNRKADMPLLETQPVAYEAATTDLLCSRLRGVNGDRPFWINEIYGNHLGWMGEMEPRYFRQTTYHALASGAKGVLFWQFRSERLTTESFDCGLTRINGEPTERSREVARLARFFQSSRKEVGLAKTPKARIAIPYDYSSDLMSRIEFATVGIFGHREGSMEAYPYKSSLRGIHLALWELDAEVDIVPGEEFEKLLGYDVVYLPCPRMVSAEQTKVLKKFVKNGGLLICEPSPGMRDERGWLTTEVTPGPLEKLFGCREIHRLFMEEEKVLNAGRVKIVCPPGIYLTRLEVRDQKNGGKVVGRYGRNEPAIVAASRGKGRTVLLGAPLGEIYFHTHQEAVLDYLTSLLRREKIKIEGLLEARSSDLRARRMVTDDGSEIVFVFNYRKERTRAGIRARGMKKIAELTDMGLKFKSEKGSFVTHIPPEEVLIAKLTK